MRVVKYILLFGLITHALSARTEWYDIDYAKSQITFLAKSRLVRANGIFRKWNFAGKIGASFYVVGDALIDCVSIDTDNERRDNHLKSVDFFDCAKYPQHVFRVRSVKPNNKNSLKATHFEITGDLTMHGVTQPIALTLHREGKDEKPSLVGSFILNRDNFGITYNSVLNPIEKEVRIELKIYLLRRTTKGPNGS
ncbi:MAG TPA: YceI family protein [Turneriella sp.]|nr:YceI family protein [Turneriella sp.]